jgi:peptide/nickel transport system substrate-binding protein
MDMDIDPNSPNIDLRDFNRWQISRRTLLKSGVVAGAAVLGHGMLAKGAVVATRATARRASSAEELRAKFPNLVMFDDPTAVHSHGLSVVPTPRAQTCVIDQGTFTVYDSFNVLIPNGEQYQAGVTQLAKEFLFYLNMATGKLQYWQGTGWSYNKNFTKCTLTIKPNVTWSDGKPMTSSDIAFTTGLMKKNVSIVGGSSNATWTPQVVSVDTPNATTAVFNLAAPNTRFHYNFIAQIIAANLLVLPEHVWSGVDVTTFKNDPPIYTGPYVLKETNPDLQLFIWEKSPNYWAKAVMNPAPQYIAFRNTPTDADEENEQFNEGLTDYNGSPTAYEYATIQIDGGDKDVVVCNFLDSDQRCIYVNCDPSRGALADPKFRYAISMLINRPKCINLWEDSVGPSTTVDVFPWPNYPNTFSWDYKSVAAKWAQNRTYNPAMAAKLLDELGIKMGPSGKREYPAGKPLNFTIITPTMSTAAEYQVGELLVEELAQLGITASLKYLTNAPFSSATEDGTWDLGSWWLGGGILDPWQLYTQFNSSYYEPLGKPALSFDQMRLKEPTFDATINKLGAADPTAASSVPLYQEALNQFYEFQPAIPYLQTVYPHISSTKYWTGWPTDSNLYEIPSNWWGQFLFVVGRLKRVM